MTKYDYFFSKFAEYYPILKKRNAIDYLFQAFNTNNTGYVSLEGFITGLSVLSSGTLQQKAESKNIIF